MLGRHMMREVWWEPVFRLVIHKLEAWQAAGPCVALLVVPWQGGLLGCVEHVGKRLVAEL